MASDYSLSSLVSGFVWDLLEKVAEGTKDHRNTEKTTLEQHWMYIKRGLETAHVGNAQLLLQDPKLHRVHFTCVDAKLLMKFSNTQEKQLHHPVIEGSRSPRWTNSNWTVHGCGGPFYPAICLRSWNNSQLSAENYEWEPVCEKKRGGGEVTQ